MKTLVSYLQETLEYLEYCNNMSPFPVYDTEYLEMIRKDLKRLKHKNNIYDDAPVTACKYCNNLFIVVDEVENDVCMRCGALNELIIYQDIFEYLTAVEHAENSSNGK